MPTMPRKFSFVVFRREQATSGEYRDHGPALRGPELVPRDGVVHGRSHTASRRRAVPSPTKLRQPELPSLLRPTTARFSCQDTIISYSAGVRHLQHPAHPRSRTDILPGL